MINFIIAASVISGVYLLAFGLLVIKRGSAYILRRTPIMLQVSLIGNLIQSIVFMSQIEQIEEDIGSVMSECHIFFRLRQCIDLISHYLLFCPYILRAYRLSIIFNIDKHWELNEYSHQDYIHRTKQKWMVAFLIVFLMPVLIMCIAILNTCSFAAYMPGSENPHHSTVSKSIYLWISFLEQTLFMFCINKLKDIADDYGMVQELTFAMVTWFITPSLLIFPPIDLQRFRNLPGLVRNFLLFFVSVVYPLANAMAGKSKDEAMTLEMIESIESVLQAKMAFEQFDRYLKEIGSKTNESTCNISGEQLLELYMKCEMYLSCPEGCDKDEIIQSLLDSDVVPMNYVRDSKETLEFQVTRAKNIVLEILKKDFFGEFKKSRRFCELKRYVHCQEIYTGRLMKIGMSKIYSSLVRNSVTYNE